MVAALDTWSIIVAAMIAPAVPLVSAPEPLTGYDEHDDPVAVEAFRQRLRLLRLCSESGMLHITVRLDGGHRRHMPMEFVQRVEGSSTRKQDAGPPPGVPDRRKR